MALGLPNQASLDAAWRRAEERRVYWDAHREQHTQDYPDQFVAVLGGNVIGHDPDLMSLVQQLRAQGHAIHNIWIEFMATGRQRLLL